MVPNDGSVRAGDTTVGILDRRRFLRSTAVAALGSSLLGGALTGCGSGTPVARLAQLVTQGRVDLNALRQLIEAAANPTAADLTAWLAEFNRVIGPVWTAATQSTQAELRANVAAEMQPYLAELDGWNEPLNFQGSPLQYSAADFQNAARSADTILAGQAPAQVRSLWMIVALFKVLVPGIDDNLALALSQGAATEDVNDYAGQLYDQYVAVTTGADRPTIAASGLFLLLLILLNWLESEEAEYLGMLLGNPFTFVLGLLLLAVLLVLSW